MNGIPDLGSSPLDLPAFFNRLKPSKEQAFTLLRLALNDLEANYGSLRLAFRDGDLDKLSWYSHRLKSNFSYLLQEEHRLSLTTWLSDCRAECEAGARSENSCSELNQFMQQVFVQLRTAQDQLLAA